MSAGSTKVRSALRRIKGLVITTGYRVWRRLPLRMRLGLKKIAAKLPKSVLSKLQRSTGMQVPVKAKPKPTFSATDLLAAGVRPEFTHANTDPVSGPGAPQTPRIYVAPVDPAGQGAALSAALQTAGIALHSVQHSLDETSGSAVNRQIAAAVAQVSEEWQRTELDWVSANFTHVLSVGANALFGELFTRNAALVEADLLRGLGVRTGFLLSDGVRLSAPDRRDNPHSPFAGATPIRSERAEEQITRLVRQLQDLDLPLFVDSPDLLGALPSAHWLPAVVPDTAEAPGNEEVQPEQVSVVQLWVNDARPVQQQVAAQLEALALAGTITYSKVNQWHLGQVRDAVRPGTIVVDDLQRGNYSVAAAHALSRGGVLLRNVTDLNRERIAAVTDATVPGLQLTTAQEVSQQVSALAAAPQQRTELSGAAQDYARQVHVGKLSAQVISRHLLGAAD